MSNRQKTKMTAAELRQLDADWQRAARIEALARTAAPGQEKGADDDDGD